MVFSRTATGRARVSVLAFLVFSTLLAAASALPEARAAGPAITILSPAQDAVIGNGTPVTVIFVVSDFNLTPPGNAGPGATASEGYVQVSVNGKLTAAVDRETIVLPLPSGLYDVALRLVLTNGTPLSPDVTASVRVTVTQGPAVGVPRIDIAFVEITFPTPGVVLNDDVTVSFRVANFTLTVPGNTPPVPNEGHVAVYLDGTYYQAVTTFDPVFFSDLTDGSHTVRMELVDNAGHALSPETFASRTFRIQASPVVDVTPYLLDAQIVLSIGIVVVLFYRGRGLGWAGGLWARIRRGRK